jgi:hypothetical protein
MCYAAPTPEGQKERALEMKRILVVAMAVSLNAWAQDAKPAEGKPAENKAGAKVEAKAEKKDEKKEAKEEKRDEKKEATAAPAAAAAPQVMKPSEETAKLAKLFGSKKAWSGKIAADGMGPGTPEMPTKGKMDCRAIADKFFYSCDMDVTTGSGKQKMTWKGHLVTGWDANAGAYKAHLIDNMGMMVSMDGALTDTTYQLTSTQEVPMMGQKMKIRFTWDWSDKKQVKYTNEHQVGDGAWQLFETEIIKGALK